MKEDGEESGKKRRTLVWTEPSRFALKGGAPFPRLRSFITGAPLFNRQIASMSLAYYARMKVAPAGRAAFLRKLSLPTSGRQRVISR